jgi:hypothetical protein
MLGLFRNLVKYQEINCGFSAATKWILGLAIDSTKELPPDQTLFEPEPIEFWPLVHKEFQHFREI